MLDITEETFNTAVKEAKKVTLSTKEKEGIRFELVDFMEKNSLEDAPAEPWWHAYFAMIRQSVRSRPVLRYVSLVAMVVLVGGGSVAFAAQNALPGDLLYSVKTGVTEKVLALTLFSNQAKAEYDINLTLLRLQETETVAAQNRLTPQSTNEVHMLLKNHITDIQKRIIDISAKEDVRVAAELNSRLEATLEAHANELENILKVDKNLLKEK